MSNEIFNEDQRKHIDIVESIITRMSENSKQMKEWCIALCSALVSIYFTIENRSLFIVSIIVVILFGFLDSYYLMLERQFRCLYADIVNVKRDANGESHNVITLYSTSTKQYKKKFDHIKALGSKSIWPFYLIVALCLVMSFHLNIFDNNDDKIQKIQIMNKPFYLEIEKPIINSIDETNPSKTIIVNTDSIKSNLEAKTFQIQK